MPKDASSRFIGFVNQALSTNYTTIAECVEAINQAITGQLITIGQIMTVIGILQDLDDNPTNCIGTFCLHDIDPTYWYQLLQASSDGTITAVAGASSAGGGTQYVLQQKYQLDLPSSIDIKVTSLGNTSGGGSSTESSGIDYIQLHSNGADNHIIFTFEKGMMDTPTMVTDINNGITGLNTQLGLSIPAYNKLTDLSDIIAYIGNLSSSYMQAKVIFWSSMFSFISYCALSVKGQINGEVCPISIEAIADSTDSIYTFAIKYLSANSNPFGYVDWFSPTNWLSSDPLCLVNELD